MSVVRPIFSLSVYSICLMEGALNKLSSQSNTHLRQCASYIFAVCLYHYFSVTVRSWSYSTWAKFSCISVLSKISKFALWMPTFTLGWVVNVDIHIHPYVSRKPTFGVSVPDSRVFDTGVGLGTIDRIVSCLTYIPGWCRKPCFFLSSATSLYYPAGPTPTTGKDSDN